LASSPWWAVNLFLFTSPLERGAMMVVSEGQRCWAWVEQRCCGGVGEADLGSTAAAGTGAEVFTAPAWMPSPCLSLFYSFSFLLLSQRRWLGFCGVDRETATAEERKIGYGGET
jgi:hypothetical protein